VYKLSPERSSTDTDNETGAFVDDKVVGTVLPRHHREWSREERGGGIAGGAGTRPVHPAQGGPSRAISKKRVNMAQNPCKRRQSKVSEPSARAIATSLVMKVPRFESGRRLRLIKPFAGVADLVIRTCVKRLRQVALPLRRVASLGMANYESGRKPDRDGLSILAAFEVPDHAEVLVVTHLLELPRDLALPERIAYAIVERESPRRQAARAPRSGAR
jgi:hypothetical protein